MEKNKERTLCISCKEEISKKGVIFSCPKCMKQKIVRCAKCRKLSSVYVCENCGFEGP